MIYENKYLKYKQKYLNIKYGGTYGVSLPPQPTIKIKTMAGETIVEIPTDGFTIETLIASPDLDFYNSIFSLLHNEDHVYSDNDTYEINAGRILAFARQMQGESCILSIVKITDVYTGGPTINPPLDKTERSEQLQDELPEEIPGIITFDNGELVINLRGILNLSELNYINLSNYTHNMIKKIRTTSDGTIENNFLKIILPNNPNIEEIGDDFFSFSRKIKTINFNNLSNLIRIKERFLESSRIEILDLENNIHLIQIESSFMHLCKNLKSIKLPISIQILGPDFCVGLIIQILDLENCINLKIIERHFCYNSNLTSIKLPQSILYIGENFFRRSTIRTLDLSNCINLKEISNKFANVCDDINLIKLPVSIIKIGEKFLDDSEIDQLDLENCIGLKDIPTDFLKKCDKLLFVKLPPQLQHIIPTLTQ